MSTSLGSQHPDPTAGFMTRSEAMRLWNQQGQELMRELREEDYLRLRELADAVGVHIFIRIARAVCAARRAHEIFASGPEDAVKQIRAEMLKWEALASSVREFGEFAAETARDISDGDLPTERLARIDKEGDEAIEAILKMKKLARATHEKQYGGGK